MAEAPAPLAADWPSPPPSRLAAAAESPRAAPKMRRQTTTERHELLARNTRRVMLKARSLLRLTEPMHTQRRVIEAREEGRSVVAVKGNDASMADFLRFKQPVLHALEQKSKHRTMGDVEVILDELSELDMIAKLTEDVDATEASVRLNALCRALMVTRVSAGETIVAKDQRCTAVYIIFFGSVELKDASERAGPRSLARGDAFGDHLVLDAAAGEERWEANYVATADSLLFAAKRCDLDLMQQDGAGDGSPTSKVDHLLNVLKAQKRHASDDTIVARGLRSFEFFRQLPNNAVRHFAKSASLRILAQGEELFIANESSKRSEQPQLPTAFKSPRCGLQGLPGFSENEGPTKAQEHHRASLAAASTLRRASVQKRNADEVAKLVASVQDHTVDKSAETLYFLLRGKLRHQTHMPILHRNSRDAAEVVFLPGLSLRPSCAGDPCLGRPASLRPLTLVARASRPLC